MKKTFLYLLFFALSQNIHAQGGAMADLKFEEAETAFNSRNYSATISKLDEFDKAFGSVTAKSLYLRIISQDKLFNAENLYTEEAAFTLLTSLRKNASGYLKAMESEGLDDKYREVYAINDKLKEYPADKLGFTEKIKSEKAAAKKIEEEKEEKLRKKYIKFDHIVSFSEGIAAYMHSGFSRKTSYFNKNGDILFSMNNMDHFSSGLVQYYDFKTNKYGFVNKSGSIVIPNNYTGAHSFSEGLAFVTQHRLYKKWGFINSSGNAVTPFKYDMGVGNFSEGMAAVGLGGKSGFIDKTGQEIIACQYENAGDFSEGLAAVKLNGKWGFIDKTGQIVIPYKYGIKTFNGYAQSKFSDGMVIVSLDGKYGYIDKSGKEIIACQYENAGDFSEGLAAVKLDGKWSFIDKFGVYAFPEKYESYENDNLIVFAFSEGLATVKLNGKWGFIDRKGKTVIPFIYENAYGFSEGFASVQLNGKWGLIDKEGKVLIIND